MSGYCGMTADGFMVCPQCDDEWHSEPCECGCTNKRKRAKVYVSGPMTGLPEFNFPAFNAAEAMLREQGYDVENPASKGIIDGWEWEDYLRLDLRLITECDAIYLLPGWENSRGARLEVHVADELGLERLS